MFKFKLNLLIYIVQNYRLYIAWLLLFSMLRVLLPESAVLALHAHRHTTAEPAHAAAFSRTGKALLSSRHQHCAVEQFYDVAYQPAPPVLLPVPPVARRYAVAEALPAARAALSEALFARSLRGPPARA